MLQVKSFDITEGEEISKFLHLYRLAEGAHVFISEGKLAIPYEDGNPMTVSQRVIQLQVEKSEFTEKQRLMVHSQRVLEIQKQGIEKEMARVKESINMTPSGKEDYDKNKSADAELKRLQNVSDQTDNQILMNQAELTRIMTNIAVYDEAIAQLSSKE